jgi:hypothetical protein
MRRILRVAAATTFGLVVVSLAGSAQAGNGSAIGIGIASFGIGALLGSALAPTEVYVAPPPPPYYYYGPVGYGPPPPYWYGNRPYPRPQMPPPHVSDHPPRPALTPKTATRSGTGTAEQQSDAKLKAAQLKAEKLGGVQKLTKQDIDGLSPEQLKQLRGY